MKKMFTSRFFSAIGTPVLSKNFPLSVWLLFAFANVIQAQTWTSITPPSGSTGYVDIDFIDANNGALGMSSGGDVAWTTNGGASWSKNADIAADMYSVDMVDANTIFAIGGGGNRVRTLNGGSTWDVSNIFPGHFHGGIRFATPSVGWAADFDGRLFKTTNSGTNWTLQTNLGAIGGWVKAYVVSTTVAYWPTHTGKTIKKTTDGTTWSTVYTASSANIDCVTGIDANNIWAGLSDGTIVKTTDGGANWTSYSTGVNFLITAIDFVSANEGWLIGTGGRIFYTSNGGVNWTQQASGTTNDLYGLSMVSSNLGFVCGNNQALLKFTNCSAEINLRGGSPLTDIADGDITPSTTEGTDFGTVATGSNLARTFTIQNTGTSLLTISSITSSNGVFTISGAPASVAAGGSATFTVTFTPTAGGAQTATITVNNNDCDEAVYDFAVTGTGCVPPSFSTCPSSAVTANAGAGQCSAAVSYTVTATGSPTPALTYTFAGATTGSGTGTGSGSTFNKGNTTVTVTAASSCGTSATCTFTVTVVDNEPPAITCPADITINNTPGLCTGTATLASPVVSDNCYTTFGNALAFDGSSDLVNIPSGLGQSLNGTNKVTVEAMINPSVMTASGQYHILGDYYSGNPNYKFIFRIESGQKISFWIGGNQLVSNTVLSVNQWYHVAGTWDGTTMRIYINGVLDNSKAQGGTFNSVAQVTKIGYGALSEYFNGKMDEVRVWNVARTATQIQENYNTMLSAQPNLIALYHFDQGIAGGNNTTITTATDDSGNAYDGTLSTFTLMGTMSNWVAGMASGVVNVTNNHPSSIYTNGANTVTWTATDAAGNTATCEQTVTVLDTEVPVLTAPANQALNVIANTCAADYTIADPIADICPGSTWGYILSGATTAAVTGIADGTGSGAVSFNSGLTTVTLTGVDAAGNAAAQQTFTVTVTDNQAPAITCPSNANANNDAGQCSAIVTFTAPVGTDNCSGPTTSQTGGLASGAVFPVGTTTNTFTVTDAIGLTASCAFTVTVSDNQAPTITCPANITTNNDAGLCSAVVAFTAPTGTDNCSSPTTAQTGGLASGAAFPVGTTTNTFTVTAANGQTGTCAFTVTVNAADANVMGNGIPVAAGDNMPAAADGTEFGLVPANTSLSRTFTLQNTGAAALTISSITSSNALFVVNSAPTSVSAGGSANFTVTFSPVAAGLESSVITINSDDCDESVYDFTVQGTGLLCSVIPPAGANVYRWTNGSGNGLWNNAANWLDNSNVPGVPGAGATAFFACSGPTNATLDINTTVAKIIVDASYPATLQLGAQTLSITQQLTVPSAAQLNAGTSLVKLTGSTTITVNTTAPLYNMEIITSDNVQLLQNAVVSNNLTITSVSIMYGNQQIQVSGNVIINDVWAEAGGNICTVSLVGSTDQSISGTGNATYLDISKTGGNVLLTDDLGLASGKLTGTGLLKNMGGKVSINNNYAWAFTGTADDLDVNAGTTNNFQLLQNVVVNNNLTITSVNIMYGDKQIQVSGNVVINDVWAQTTGGSICTISLVGSTDQSISGTGNATYLDISKTGGNVLLTDDLGLASGKLTGTGLLKNMGGKVSINNDYTWAFTGNADDLDVNAGSVNNFQLLQNAVVNNTLTITSVGIMYGDKQIRVSGNVLINDVWAQTTGSSICTISLVGSTDQSISGTGNASYLDISKTGGNVLLTDDLGLASGKLTGTGLLKNMGGKVSINNDYTWAFTGTADDLDVNAGSVNNFQLLQNAVVNNTLTITSVSIMYGNKQIQVSGNVLINDAWAASGSSICTISLVGATDQSISGGGNATYLDISKTGGDVLLTDDLGLADGTLTGTGLLKNTGGKVSINNNYTWAFTGTADDLVVNAGSTNNLLLQQDVVVNNTLTISSVNIMYGNKLIRVPGDIIINDGWAPSGASTCFVSLVGTTDQNISGTGPFSYFNYAKPSGDALFNPAFNKTFTSATVTAGTWNTFTGTYTSSGGFTATGGNIMGRSTFNGNVTFNTGSSFIPGSSPGCVTINGNLTMNAGSTLNVEIEGFTACTEYDQTVVNGTITINGATLVTSSPSALYGQAIVFVNDAADAIAGTKFAGAAQGAILNIGGADYKVSYTGGTGNDFTLTSNLPPVAVCQNRTFGIDANCQPPVVTVADINNGSSDPDGDPITVDMSPAGPFALGTTTVTLTVTDIRNATSTCVATVSIVDNTPPTITCPGAVSTNVDAGQCSAVVITTDPVTSDLCSTITTLTWTIGGATGGSSPATGINNLGTYTFSKGINIVTYTVTEAAGNTATCSFNITVIDNIPPTVTCAADVTINNTTGLCTGTTTLTPPAIVDNCPVNLGNALDFRASNVVSLATPIFSTSNASQPYTIEMWVKVDPSNNTGGALLAQYNTSANAVRWAIRLDATNKVSYWKAGNYLVSSITALDDNTWHHIAFVKSGSGANQLAMYVDGVLNDTGTDADAFQNTNTVLCDFVGSASGGMLGAIDELRVWNVAKSPAQIVAGKSIEMSAQPGLILLYHFNQGTAGGTNTGVTTLNDASGNAFNGTLSGFALTGATSNWVAGAQVSTATSNAPAAFAKGTNTVTWTCADGSGNTVTCTQTVTVIDNQVPVLTAPANQTINTIANTCAANYTIADPITDNCTGATWSYVLSGATTATVTGIADGTGSGAVSFNKGVTTVTLTGVDASGNLAVQKTFTVTVNDNIVPTISGCPTNQTMNVVPGTCSQTFGIPYPTLADNCAGPLTWNAAFLGNYSGSPANFTAQADMTNGPTRTFNAGITTVTLSATDASGNNSTVNCTFTVTVIDNQPPVITCASNITVNNTPGLCTGTATVPPPAVTDICSMLGTSLDLDGVNDFVTVPTAIGVAHTIEFWFNAPSPINNSSQADRLFNFSGNGNFWIGTNETASGISGETVNVGGEGPSGFGHLAIKNVLTGWNHIAIVSNGTEYTTIYLNGGTVPLFTNASLSNRKPPVYNITSMVIGKLNTALTTGKFDEIRFWSTQRTQAEIQANLYTEVAPQTGLLAVYHLNEGLPNGNNTALTTIVDDGGSAHNGTLSGFAQTGTTSNWVPGVLGVSYTNSVNGTAIGSGTFPKGVTTVTWTGADAAGNTATCQQTVTVLDNEVPVLTAPANQTINTIANTCAGNYTIADPITENCTGSTWGYTLSGATTAAVTGIADGTGSGAVSFNKGVTTVTLTGVDASGNLAVEKTFTVTVNDNIVPTLTCPANQSINVAAGTCSQDLGIPYPTLADNCAGPLTWNAAFSGNGAGNPAGLTAQANMTNGATRTFNKGATTVTLSATDASGNNSTVNCTFTVTVTDNEPPVITCASNVTVNSTTGLCTGTATVLQPVVSDNCNTLGGSLDLDGVNDFVTVSTAIGTVHTIEFWLNAADPINGTSPSNMLFNFSGNPNWWMDTNQSTSGIADETFTVGGTGSSGPGQLAIKNVLTGWNHIAVVSNGTEYTTIYVNGIPVTVFTNPNISNRRPPVFDITSMIIGKRVGGGFSGEYKGKYDEIRFWSTQRTQAQIQANMNLEAAAQTGLLAVYHCNEGSAYGDNTALSDIVDDAGGAHNGVLSGFAQTGCTSNWTPGVSGVTYANNVNGTCDASGIYPKGPTTVTWTATDAAGNTATCQQTVTVVDNEVPVLTAPANQTINTIANTCAGNYTIADPINDNCTGSTWGYTLSGATTATVTGIADGTGSGAVSFNKGVTTITLTGVDASGNLAVEKTFTVTVNDNIVPTLTCPSNQSINTAAASCSQDFGIPYPTLADNCAGPLTWNATFSGNAAGNPAALSAQANMTNGATRTFNKGATTVTLSATDASGNNSTVNCTFTVTVVDNTPPAIACAADVTVNNTPGLCTGTATLGAPTTSDNCPNISTTGNAIHCDGINDYLESTPLSLGTGNFTIECWVKQTALANYPVLFAQDEGGVGSPAFRMEVSNGSNTLLFVMADASSSVAYSSTSSISVGTWVHVAVVRSGNTYTTFINGVAAGTATIAGSINQSSNTFNFRIGARRYDASGAPGNPFQGIFDDFRVWNVARSGAQLQAAMNNELVGNESGLIRYYKFNQGTAGGNNTGINTANATIGANATLINFGLMGATSNWVAGTAASFIGTTVTNNAPTTYNIGNNTVTWTATDAAGNSSTCQQIVTVVDNEVPVLTAPANQALNVITNTCAANYTITDPIADNCTGSTWGYTLSGATTATVTGIADGTGSGVVSFNTGITTVTLTGVDASGNLAVEKTFTVTVTDNQAPAITCPANIAVNNDLDQCGAIVTYNAPSGTDNCSGAITAQTAGLASGSLFPVGSTTNTFVVTAANLQTANCSFTVTVTDNQAPAITCPANIAVTNDVNQCGAVVTYNTPSGTDNCSGATTAQTAGQASGSLFPVGSTTNTFVVTAANLQTANCSFTVTVTDNQAPAITCPANIAVNNDVNQCGAVVTFTAPTGTDNCAGATTAQTAGLASGSLFPVGSTTNTFVVTAANLQTANCSFTVTVTDNQTPAITCPANIGVNNDGGQCGAVVTYNAPVGTDNCSGATTAQTTGLASGALFPVGTTTNTFVVTAANLQTANCSFTVTVTDNQVPAITCPANIAVNNDVNQCGAVVTYNTPSGTDNCSGATTAQTAGLASGSLFPVGSTTNTFVVTAANLQTANCSFTVTVTDNQAPAITCPANIAVTNDVNECGAVVTYNTPSGTDNCSGATTAQTVGLASGSLFPVGSTTNTFVVTAANLQTANCSFTVTVTDNQAPAITCPANIAVTNDVNQCGAVVTYNTPSGTDNCSGATTAQTAGLASGSLFPLGTTTNTFVVTAANLQTANCSFTVTVTDNQAPAITCPANIGVNNDAGQCGAVVTYNAPTGTDNCSGATTAQTTGLASGAVYPVGSTTNTFVATEANGQTASCSFMVTVTDAELPTITCPANTVSAPVQGLCSAVVNGIDAVYSDNCVVATLGYTSSGATVLSGSGQASGQSFSPGLTTVTYTVTDGVSLVNTCSFTVTMSPCVQISGNIKWENNNAPVKDADVRLEILPGATPLGSVLTNTAGNYTLNPGTAGDYRIRPVKNINLLNGVTVADATRIQQHITNNPPLSGPYKRIAADVNKSNSITTYDANLIAQAIAGSPAALLTFNTSWRFVPTSYTFPNPNVPWGFPEKIDFTGLTTSQTNVNFVGVKIGDVNGSSNPQLKPAPPVVWQVEDAVLEAGQPVTLRFAVDHFEDIAAYQFALGFDPAILRYNDMSVSDAIPMNAENIGAFEAETGVLRLVWFTDRGRSVKSGTTVFTLHFTAQSSGVKLSDVLHLDDKALQGIGYNTALEERGVALVYTDAQTSGIIDPNQPAGLELLQNVPNPTIGQTTIGFVLPQSCEAQLRILDVNGRLVTTRTGVYPAGYQQESFDISGHSGVLYYELTTPFGTLVKKMVVVAD